MHKTASSLLLPKAAGLQHGLFLMHGAYEWSDWRKYRTQTSMITKVLAAPRLYSSKSVLVRCDTDVDAHPQN